MSACDCIIWREVHCDRVCCGSHPGVWAAQGSQGEHFSESTHGSFELSVAFEAHHGVHWWCVHLSLSVCYLPKTLKMKYALKSLIGNKQNKSTNPPKKTPNQEKLSSFSLKVNFIDAIHLISKNKEKCPICGTLWSELVVHRWDDKVLSSAWEGCTPSRRNNGIVCLEVIRKHRSLYSPLVLV